MNKWSNLLIAPAAVVIVLGIMAANCIPGPEAPVPVGPIIINVGLPTPLTNPGIPWGRANVEPYSIWIDLFNEKGFEVDGKTYNFKLFTADDRDTPEGGTAAAQQ
jgi:hypothetical protein